MHLFQAPLSFFDAMPFHPWNFAFVLTTDFMFTCIVVYSKTSAAMNQKYDDFLLGFSIQVRTIRLLPTSLAQSTNRFIRSCISAYYNCLI